MRAAHIFVSSAIVILILLAFLFVHYETTIRNVWRIVRSAPPIVEDQTTGVSGITVPTGFKLSIFAEEVEGARVITYDPFGNLVVSQTKEGKVSALLPDHNNDGKSDGQVVLLSGLDNPHGITFMDGRLLVAETSRVRSYEYVQDGPKVVGEGTTLFDLPSGGRHFTRTLLLAPNPEAPQPVERESLFVSIGSSCDVCVEKDTRLASVQIYNETTKKIELFAKGLRNSVFMALHPVTGAIFATEMGRDWLGDNLPPDEVNIIQKNKNYGWPICFGKNIHDSEFDKNTYIRNPCMEPFETPSHVDLQAHSAPLGLAFIPEEGWPEEWWHHLLVAYHGSWNRDTPMGYKIVRIPMDPQGKQIGEPVDFISGWLGSDGAVSGRPVAILLSPGGSGYITDDHAGIVYRLQRTQ